MQPEYACGVKPNHPHKGDNADLGPALSVHVARKQIARGAEGRKPSLNALKCCDGASRDPESEAIAMEADLSSRPQPAPDNWAISCTSTLPRMIKPIASHRPWSAAGAAALVATNEIKTP